MSKQNEVERFEHANHTIVIMYDEDTINPREDYDNVSTLYCWHRRYNLGDKKIEPMSADELIEDIKDHGDEVLAILPLHLYEHGGITMSCGAFSDVFDSGQVGWAVITKSSADKMGFKDFNKAYLEDAIVSDVETYDCYLTGQTYGYEILDSDGDHVDSCWGFIGDTDYVKDEAKSAAKYANEAAIKTANVKCDATCEGGI